MRDFALELEQRKQAGLYRTRRQISGPQQPVLTSDGKPLLSFCSNDYLGLANHPANIDALRDALPETGLGGAASHLICGHHDAHHRLEQRLAEFTGRSSALFFSTGYMANMGVISAWRGAVIPFFPTGSITLPLSMAASSAGPRSGATLTAMSRRLKRCWPRLPVTSWW